MLSFSILMGFVVLKMGMDLVHFISKNISKKRVPQPILAISLWDSCNYSKIILE